MLIAKKVWKMIYVISNKRLEWMEEDAWPRPARIALAPPSKNTRASELMVLSMRVLSEKEEGIYGVAFLGAVD
jgi:hypothetical protein